jgi:hypothetical protein
VPPILVPALSILRPVVDIRVQGVTSVPRDLRRHLEHQIASLFVPLELALDCREDRRSTHDDGQPSWPMLAWLVHDGMLRGVHNDDRCLERSAPCFAPTDNTDNQCSIDEVAAIALSHDSV